MTRLFGTDGVRGLANGQLTAELALDLSVSAAHVLAQRGTFAGHRPLAVVGRFDVIARIHGGGITGQAGALRLGVARALNAVDLEANRATLKKAGLLTRDARVKERKKAGLKKARKAPQYSKR